MTTKEKVNPLNITKTEEEHVFEKKEHEKKIIKKNNCLIEIINGNSLEVLNKLERKYDLIYLDPPYDTGRVFQISHEDKLGFKDTWKNNEYSLWLDNFINECVKVLKIKGSLFFHISAECSLPAEIILSKYFTYIEKIFWKRCHGKNTVKKKLGAVIDIIFKCTNHKKSKFNLLKIPLGETIWAFKNKDSRGNYTMGGLRHDRTRKGNKYTIEHNGQIYDSPYGWKITKEKMEKLILDDRIHFVNTKKSKNLYKKIYEHEHEGKPLSNLWNDIHSITRSSKDPRLYPTQKPIKLLQRIIELTTDENDWVLDPVAGAGTTGHASIELKRNCTLIDKNRDSFEIIIKRISEYNA
jgi:DNA modification methylase